MKRVLHDTFTIERTVDASPARAFQALSRPEVKARWFVGPASWKQNERTHDFRVGGRDRLSGTFESGMTSVFDAEYCDIVENERIVYVYEMTVDGTKISTSLATFEFRPAGAKTTIVLTEQGAYFDDPASPKYAPEGQAKSRVEGTKALLDRLAASFAA